MRVPAADFVRDWKAARARARTISFEQDIDVVEEIEDKSYRVASFAPYLPSRDGHKRELYLSLSKRDFTDATSFALWHVVQTGIGFVITLRGEPKYILDPGGQRRSYLSARFGVTRPEYEQAFKMVRFVEKVIERETKGMRSDRREMTSRLEAAEAAVADAQVDIGVLEMEVNHLRNELRRLRPED